jgi:hypothetical protein
MIAKGLLPSVLGPERKLMHVTLSSSADGESIIIAPALWPGNNPPAITFLLKDWEDEICCVHWTTIIYTFTDN